MIVEQDDNHLTVRYCSDAKNIIWGIPFIVFGVLPVYLFLREPFSFATLLGLVIGLVLTFFGGYLLFVRPQVFTFNRVTGELSILHRTLLSQKLEHHSLSDITDLLMVFETGDADYHIELVIQTRTEGNRKIERGFRLIENSPEKKCQAQAEIVASFLGLAVQQVRRKTPATPASWS